MRLPQFGLLVSTLITVGALLLVDEHTVDAATFTVTKTADTADGTCSNSDCSLREAIIASNALPGADTIILPAGTYTYQSAISARAASASNVYAAAGIAS